MSRPARAISPVCIPVRISRRAQRPPDGCRPRIGGLARDSKDAETSIAKDLDNPTAGAFDSKVHLAS